LARGTTCFLFRHAADIKFEDRDKPLIRQNIDLLWVALLKEFEIQCKKNGEALKDGASIKFFCDSKGVKTCFPLHSLRVSIITQLAMEGIIPFSILSKLITGHSKLIMTLYYTKLGNRYVTDIMDETNKNLMKKQYQGLERFLHEQTYEQLEKKFAYNSPDAITISMQQKGNAAFIYEDKGLCTMSGSGCSIGGEKLVVSTGGMQNPYAPVPGYPLEKNCVRCRFFLTGPGFLPGLIAHFNRLSFELSDCSVRYVEFDKKIADLIDLRFSCNNKNELFPYSADLLALSRLHEQEAEKAGKLMADMHRLQ
jgi:hypothetical protein